MSRNHVRTKMCHRDAENEAELQQGPGKGLGTWKRSQNSTSMHEVDGTTRSQRRSGQQCEGRTRPRTHPVSRRNPRARRSPANRRHHQERSNGDTFTGLSVFVGAPSKLRGNRWRWGELASERLVAEVTKVGKAYVILRLYSKCSA